MIVLRANPELKNTFDTLIRTMGVNVAWNGLFVVIDNCLILQGEVRSLFFHFDSRKVLENIIELPVKEEEIHDTAEETKVQELINMILYSFGKWGTIKGLRVEKNYAQLNILFQNILAELGMKPQYTGDHFQFYENGIRVTYEDVIQKALEAKEEPVETQEEGEVKGLWHKVAWKAAKVRFKREEIDGKERRSGRLGNNFYLVGYLCPDCGRKLHMVVYPEGKEFQIETPEGAVLLARACTCETCNSFFTPRPDKMLSEGDIYRLDFGEDRRAYEDYLELLGQNGERASNCRYNRYADSVRAGDAPLEAAEDLEEACADLEHCSEDKLLEISDKIEEGFYSDESIARFEKKVREQLWLRGIADEREQKAKKGGRRLGRGGKEPFLSDPGREQGKSGAAGRADIPDEERIRERGTPEGRQGNSPREMPGRRTESAHAERAGRAAGQEREGRQEKRGREESAAMDDPGREGQELRKKYEARFQMLDRLSKRQISDLKSQISREEQLTPQERKEYIERIDESQNRHKAEELQRKVENCAGKNYAVLKRVYEEIKQEQIPDSMKAGMLGRLREWMGRQADLEVKEILEKMPPNLDRARYQSYLDRIQSYEEADASIYEETLKQKRRAAEQQEVANLVNRSRKSSRSDIKELIDKLKKGDYLQEIADSFLEKLEERLREYDEEAVEEILKDPHSMDFTEAKEAYEAIANGDFLPEIKENALKLLEKRLAKIKSDECELLVKKLQEELREAGIAENERHHFYPARKMLMKQADPEEMRVIDFALATYGAGRGLFEYPILVVDSTRGGSGKEGMILTPEHLYYSTLLTSYGIDVFSIDSITASTGFLNRGLYVRQKNGTKLKIPYAVDHKELPDYAKVLEGFVKYLQEKPDSRKVSYLAKGKHDTICCFRCGYVYKGGATCPKCGYKNNE